LTVGLEFTRAYCRLERPDGEAEDVATNNSAPFIGFRKYADYD